MCLQPMALLGRSRFSGRAAGAICDVEVDSAAAADVSSEMTIGSARVDEQNEQ